jgi:hypothetical protein
MRLFVVASTSRIFAPGAIACAHSTSMCVSNAQPASLAGEVVPPTLFTFVKHPFAVVQLGRPNCWSRTARSASMVGASNALTMPIVWPLPSEELVGKS